LVKSTSNQNQIKMAKVAISKGVVVWAAPWGPGKDWQTVYGTNSKGQDQIKFNMTYAPQWAAALAQYVKDMKAAGVPLVGLSAQNEPDGDNFNHFEAADLTTWIRDYLGPALEGTGVPVIAPETVNWCSFPTYKSSIMNDAKASSYVPIIATHEYGCSPKAYPEINQAGKEFWETEIYDDNATADPGIESGLRTAKLMHEALTIASVNAWHYWWGHGGANDGLFPNNSSTPTKRLWVMGNFARFVRPGFVRIAAPASPATGLTMSAYYGAATNRVVVVAINTTTAAVSRTFGVSGLTPTKVTPWVTDASNDLQAQTAVSLSGNQFTYAIPAKSVTSLVIDQ
jgi:glucuronoarabinoxylan endo-1,4-beta-xylanase